MVHSIVYVRPFERERDTESLSLSLSLSVSLSLSLTLCLSLSLSPSLSLSLSPPLSLPREGERGRDVERDFVHEGCVLIRSRGIPRPRRRSRGTPVLRIGQHSSAKRG